MIARSRRAIISVAGATMLALLVGCAQSPATMRPYPGEPTYYASPSPDAIYAPAPGRAPRPAYRERVYTPMQEAAPSPAQREPVIADDAPPRPSRPERPALVPADPDCGWWDVCNLWMGGAGT